jgi:hypothetical protein
MKQREKNLRRLFGIGMIKVLIANSRIGGKMRYTI